MMELGGRAASDRVKDGDDRDEVDNETNNCSLVAVRGDNAVGYKMALSNWLEL